MTRFWRILWTVSIWLLVPTAWAGQADVLDVQIHETSSGVFAFDVTVQHADSGWEHFADKWEVVGPDGSVLATRILAHPHDAEQPFTRSLSGIHIPAGTKEVTVRAHDKVHGWGGKTMTVALP